MNIYRQGDVLIREVTSLPTGAKKLTTNVLAYGEVTGHSHRFQGDAQLYGYGNELYMQVYQPTYIEHEEHQHKIVDPGIYKIEGEQEWDYIEESMKKVID